MDPPNPLLIRYYANGRMYHAQHKKSLLILLSLPDGVETLAAASRFYHQDQCGV